MKKLNDIQQLVESIQDHRSCNHMDPELNPVEISQLVDFNLDQIEYILTGDCYYYINDLNECEKCGVELIGQTHGFCNPCELVELSYHDNN